MQWCGMEKGCFAHRLFSRLFTCFLAMVAWIFFRAENTSKAIYMVLHLFTKWNPWILVSGQLYTLGLAEEEWLLFILCIILLIAVSIMHEKGIRIREALKHQSPKVIVLDVFTVYGDDYEEEGTTHINLDGLPLSFNKIMAIRDSVPAGMRYAYYFPLAKYHNTWTDFYEGKATYAFYNEKDPYKGYSPFVFAVQYEDLHILISSPGNLPDQSASIVVNGTDFSLDCDGLNIAVYDKVLGEMFEMIALDATQDMTIIRK